MGMFKWLRKDFGQWDRNRRNLASPEHNGLNNEAYRNALQAFLDRRRSSDGSGCIISPNSPSKKRIEIFKKNNDTEELNVVVPGVPHVPAQEVFEIGCVAGTEDRYLELISAEWQQTRISLRRHTHPECFNAVRADLDVLVEIRHPNMLLLMGTTQTDEHGLVAMFEPVDCTLYNYVHEQGERISVQGAARCAGQLAEALRHAHTRGLIHGALSSHCVYLASSGTVKLGGWELAVREGNLKPHRKWEDRLRSEIFRWQAPELFYGDVPSRASDVYGLTLLIWEMCTMRVPWSGLCEPEVERQYIHWERGVVTDLYNFPPLLNNLLEAGLQLDVTKRSLDMNRMRRFLQRIEMQYEEEDPIYIDHYANNNNPHVKTFNAPVSTSPIIDCPVTPKRPIIETPKRTFAKKRFNSAKPPCNKIIQTSPRKEINPEKNDLSIDNQTRRVNTAERARKNTNMDLETQKRNLEILEKAQRRDRDVYARGQRRRRSIQTSCTSDENTSETKKLVSYESSTSVASTYVRTPHTSEDDCFSDTLMDIKRLKEFLATRREMFFYGNDSPQADMPDISPKIKDEILSAAREKICEPYKPASHKTSLEPQHNTSPTAYDATLIRTSCQKNQRSPYSHVPTEIRQAILQPQVLNPDSESFFESSLWRREKSICISKMRQDYQDDSPTLPAVKIEKHCELSDSPKSDSTYIINKNTTADEHSKETNGDSAFVTDVTTTDNDSTADNVTRSKSLQALKEALDRATNIARSASSNSEESSNSSPVKNLNNSDVIIDETGERESLFEDLNRLKLGSYNPDEEIKSIERSVLSREVSHVENAMKDVKREVSDCQGNCTQNCNFNENSKYVPYDTSAVKFACESIAETSHEHSPPNQDLNSSTRQKEISSKPIRIDESMIQMVDKFSFDQKTNESNHDSMVLRRDREKNRTDPAEASLVSTALVFLSEKSQDKRCKTCHHKNILARRRSLPAGLGHLRSFNSSSPLGKLPIRRGEVPDNTVEDLYIDDEFGDLNVNMVLLDDDTLPDEEDLLPDLMEMSNAYGYT